MSTSIKIKPDKLKENRRASREVIGKPGKGRSSGAHTDKKKRNNKERCRKKVDANE